MSVALCDQAVKEQNEKLKEVFGCCILDGHRQSIGNFKIEPPGIFRGRGDNPRQGMLKKRIEPEDVVINCSAWVLLCVLSHLGFIHFAILNWLLEI